VLYPAGRYDPETLRRLATELPLPINAIALPDQDDPASWLGLTARRHKSPRHALRAGGFCVRSRLAITS
jgi:hypothetical protein